MPGMKPFPPAHPGGQVFLIKKHIPPFPPPNPEYILKTYSSTHRSRISRAEECLFLSMNLSKLGGGGGDIFRKTPNLNVPPRGIFSDSWGGGEGVFLGSRWWREGSPHISSRDFQQSNKNASYTALESQKDRLNPRLSNPSP